MEVQLIRNATFKIHYAGKNILIDPYFAEKHTQPSFCGKSKNPMTDLPFSTEEVLKDVDLILVSHLHPDHFDEVAQNTINKSILIYCQPSDYDKIKAFGFTNVNAIKEFENWEGIEIQRVNAQHGKGSFLPIMGEVSGFVLKASGEKTLYITADTIWYDGVAATIDLFKPGVIIANAGGNEFKKEYDLFQIGMQQDSGPVIMNEEQVYELHKHSPQSKIVVAHIGALDHETVSRNGLRNYMEEKKVKSTQILIPEDGEKMLF